MDTLTLILLAAAAFGLLGLAWLGGYETGHDAGSDAERALCNTRVKGILAGERRIQAVVDYENNRKPKSAKCRRKAARKAVRA